MTPCHKHDQSKADLREKLKCRLFRIEQAKSGRAEHHQKTDEEYCDMVSSGIIEESAYYESLHETPLIANLIARKKLYEMNKVISDTAEYGCYLFAHAAVPMLADFMRDIDTDVIGKGLAGDHGVDNQELIAVNAAIRNHPVEIVGRMLRSHMTAMKKIV